jgi:hypothetical protein
MTRGPNPKPQSSLHLRSSLLSLLVLTTPHTQAALCGMYKSPLRPPKVSSVLELLMPDPIQQLVK